MSPRCDRCTHFEGGGLAIEAAFPGLSALSSGDASVRGDDGLCTLRELYLSGRDGCASFAGPAGRVAREG